MSPAAKEINVVGVFDWQPRKTIAEEVALLKHADDLSKKPVPRIVELWAPGTRDWEAIAPGAIPCDSLMKVLATIAVQAPNTVRRLNIFSHGETGRISFAGHMKSQDTSVDVFFEDSVESRVDQENDDPDTAPKLGMLNVHALRKLRRPGVSLEVGPLRTKYTLGDIRKRFMYRSRVVLYSCRSGTNPQLAQELADTLGVLVFGLSVHVAFCPRWTLSPPTIDRSHMALGGCPAMGSVYNFETKSYDALLTRAGIERLVIRREPSNT